MVVDPRVMRWILEHEGTDCSSLNLLDPMMTKMPSRQRRYNGSIITKIASSHSRNNCSLVHGWILDPRVIRLILDPRVMRF